MTLQLSTIRPIVHAVTNDYRPFSILKSTFEWRDLQTLCERDVVQYIQDPKRMKPRYLQVVYIMRRWEFSYIFGTDPETTFGGSSACKECMFIMGIYSYRTTKPTTLSDFDL